MVQEMFGGQVPKEIIMPKPAFLVAGNQSQDIRDLEIQPERFTPPDQLRTWVREWPMDLKINPAALTGPPPTIGETTQSKKGRSSRTLGAATGRGDRICVRMMTTVRPPL
jgi:hypothetical protein